MCGRFNQRGPSAALAETYGAVPDRPATLLAPGERTPGARVLAVLGETPVATAAVWGVAAEWLRRGELLRHARGETATTKPFFRGAAAGRPASCPPTRGSSRDRRRAAGAPTTSPRATAQPPGSRRCGGATPSMRRRVASSS